MFTSLKRSKRSPGALILEALNPGLAWRTGVAGMPQMGEAEMMKELMSGSKVAKGKARRKKNVTRGMAALAELQA